MNWQNMPEHLYFHIFQYLDWCDLLSASEVCSEWHSAVRRSEAWLENTDFAISQFRWYDALEVVDPAVVNNLSSNYQNLIVNGFVVEEWCDEKFKQMCDTFSTMVQQCDIRGFTLTVPVGSRFFRDFLISNEQHLQNVEDFTLYIQNTFCDSHTYNFIIKFEALRRIRILQSPLVDLLSRQAVQFNSKYLEEITACSNTGIGLIFNNPKAKLKVLRLFVHSYHKRIIQEVISIHEFTLETLVIECPAIDPWIDYIITFLLPLLRPQRLVINQRQIKEDHELDEISKHFEGTGIFELVLMDSDEPLCACGFIL